MEKENIVELKEDLKQKLVEELPVFRAKAKISQETLAEMIGVSRQTLGMIEIGKKEMNWRTFMALIAYFQNNEQTRDMLMNNPGFETLRDVLL